MALLTKRSMGLGDGYRSGYSRPQLIDKLGGIEYKGPDLAGEICEKVCKHLETAYDLSDLCELCPLKQLMDLIE